MSILIKGMKMPTNCWECPMVSGYEIADEVRTRCSTVRCRLTNTKRPAGEAIAPNCPLIPAPPHGRLIVEDDAIETAWMILTGLGYRRDENPQLEQAVRDVFATAPAI